MIGYLSHEVGSDETFADLQQRQANVANAVAWLAYLTRATYNLVVTMPWYVNVVAFGQSMKDRVLRDQTTMMRRCDLLILVGRPPRGHQLVERTDAYRWRLHELDLTDQPWAPPDIDSPEDHALRAVMAERLSASVAMSRFRL